MKHLKEHTQNLKNLSGNKTTQSLQRQATMVVVWVVQGASASKAMCAYTLQTLGKEQTHI
jgi:hypothetical protein